MKYVIIPMALITLMACSKKEVFDKPDNDITTTKVIDGFSELPDGWASGWMVGRINQIESAQNRPDTLEAIVRHIGAFLRLKDNTGYHVMALGNPTKYTTADSKLIAGVFNAKEELLCYIEVHPRQYMVNGSYVKQQQSFSVLDSMMAPKPPFDKKVESPGYQWIPIW